MPFVKKYLIRFDLPLNFVSVENNAEAIIDLHYTSPITAFKDYIDLTNTGAIVDLIQLIDGVEYCLM